MYSGPLYRTPFQPDPTNMQHREMREEYSRMLRQREETLLTEDGTWQHKPESLSRLLEMVSPEDSALIALIVFLLCDNTTNDVVLLGILLYVLLSK